MKEGGMDLTNVERLTHDRKEWKETVRKRMEHVDVCERQKGHKYVWGTDEAAVNRVEERRDRGLDCRYGCGKRCK